MPPETKSPSLASGWSPDVEELRSRYGPALNNANMGQVAAAEAIGGVLQGGLMTGTQAILGMVGLAKQVITDPVGTFNSAKEAVTNFVSDPAAIPGKVADAVSNEYDRVVSTAQSGPQGLGQVLFEYAPNPVGRSTAGVPKQDIFIGPKANDWDRLSNDLAIRLEADGASPDDIWKITGNRRGADGKWRQEADTSNASFKYSGLAKVLAGRSVPLRDVYSNPVFERNYPDLYNNIIVQGKFDPREGWVASMGDGRLQYNFGSLLRTDPLQLRKTKDDALDTFEHELQHSVQNIEDFNRGASPTYWQQRKNLLSDLPDELGVPSAGSRDPFTPPQFRRSAYYTLVNKARDTSLPIEERRIAYQQAIDFQKRNDPVLAYWRTGGEEEARLAETRRKFSEQARIENFPELTPPFTQIVHYGGTFPGSADRNLVSGMMAAYPNDDLGVNGARAISTTNVVLNPWDAKTRSLIISGQEPFPNTRTGNAAYAGQQSPSYLSYRGWLAEKIGKNPDSPEVPKWIAELKSLEDDRNLIVNYETDSIPLGENLDSLLRAER